MALHTLIKNNGKEVTVNDNSLKYALSLGWKKKSAKVEKQPTKATEKKKAKKAK